MLFNKTKYYLLVYAYSQGFGNATYTVKGKDLHLDLRQALNWIQSSNNILNPIIINIIEITKKQNDEFNKWVRHNKKII